jgi:hypothetical protein
MMIVSVTLACFAWRELEMNLFLGAVAWEKEGMITAMIQTMYKVGFPYRET